MLKFSNICNVQARIAKRDRKLVDFDSARHNYATVNKGKKKEGIKITKVTGQNIRCSSVALAMQRSWVQPRDCTYLIQMHSIMHCKSLGIKASSKCVNVKIQFIVFRFLLNSTFSIVFMLVLFLQSLFLCM